MSEKNTSSDQRYLEKLEFRPELRKTWLNFFVVNFRVVALLIMLLSAWGIYSFLNLPLESDPEVKIPFAMVTTVFPGASPSDVEELVTKKIETAISGVKGIKKITSSSANSFSAVSVEFDTSQNQDDSLRSLRDEVSSINDLPENANTPLVKEVSFDDRPIFTISLTGPYDGLTLKKYADEIKDELEKLPGVREVQVSGGDEEEFEIAYDPQKLTFFNLSPNTINQTIASANVAFPGGNFEGEKFNYSIRTDARFFDAEKLKNIPVSHTDSGALIFLKDIAEVREKAIKKTLSSRLSIKGGEPQNAVTIDVVKKTGSSIVDTVDSSKKLIEEKVRTFPPKIAYDTTTDFAKIIRNDFNQLTHDFFLTLALVFGILFLIVGLKEATVAGLAIPLVFFVTFGAMLTSGISLNFLSIFSLLLSLGLLVDDAIVVVSATKQYLNTGKFTPEEAVLLVLNDFKVVLTTTTLTTVWAFLPLLMATGIIGSYIKSIPITVSVTLISSLFVALMINHPLAAVLERIRLTRNIFFLSLFALLGLSTISFFYPNPYLYVLSAACVLTLTWLVFWYRKGGRSVLENNQKLTALEWKNDELIKKKLLHQGSRENQNFSSRLLHGIVHFDRLVPIYEKYLRSVVLNKKIRLTAIIAIFFLFVLSVSLPISGIVKQEFFPASDEENLYIGIEAPVGLNLKETDRIARSVEEKLLKYPEIINFSTVSGRAGASPSGGGLPGAPNSSHLASIVVTLTPPDQRDVPSYDLAVRIRNDVSEIKEATISVESARGGPPSGSPFEARIIGEDLQTLDKITQNLKPILEKIPGTTDIKSSLKEAPAEYTFSLDPQRLEFYNLNAAYVGSTIRMAISGTKISTVIKENKEIEVNARFQETKLPDLAAIQNLQIANFQNQPVFLKDVSTVKLNPSVDSIARIDQKRVVLLTAGVEGNTLPNDVLNQFQAKLKEASILPPGYSIVYGGENEQNTESVISIIRAMIIAIVLIVSTLVIQFNSFKKAAIVLTTLPLALIGVFFGMAAFGVTLSFPGLIGILALFGIVVKNAIILIDKINLNIKSGIPFDESIIDAGKSRLEAIFITSIVTIFGLIPVTLSNATWMALGSVVIFGLMLSSFLTLFIVPALFKTIVKYEECC